MDTGRGGGGGEGLGSTLTGTAFGTGERRGRGRAVGQLRRGRNARRRGSRAPTSRAVDAGRGGGCGEGPDRAPLPHVRRAQVHARVSAPRQRLENEELRVLLVELLE